MPARLLSPSKIFFYSLLAFIIGIYFGEYKLLNYFLESLFLIFLIVIFAYFYKNKLIKTLALCGIFFILGAFWYQYKINLKIDTQEKITKLFNQKINLQGIICEETEQKEKTQSLVFCPKKSNEIPNSKSKILITAPLFPEYSYGSLLKIQGKLQEPQNFNDFDYKKYLFRQGIYATIFQPKIEILKNNKGNLVKTYVFKLKNRFQITTNQIFSEPSASFLNALLFGIRTNLPESLQKALSRTGTTHIIAISGYNITIIARLLSLVLVGYFLKRQQAFYLIVCGISLFVLLTGAEASVVRAGIMGVLVLFAGQTGRLSHTTNVLALSAFLMLWHNPESLRFDIGFQLSFLAAIGLIYLSPFLEEKFSFLPKTLELRASLATTLSAQIFVLPLLIYYFKNLSLIAPLANLLILPIIPWLMLFGFIAIFLGIFLINLGWTAGFLAWILMLYEIKMITLLAKIPGAVLEMKIEVWMVWLYYLLLILVFFLIKKTTKTNIVWRLFNLSFFQKKKL